MRVVAAGLFELREMVALAVSSAAAARDAVCAAPPTRKRHEERISTPTSLNGASACHGPRHPSLYQILLVLVLVLVLVLATSRDGGSWERELNQRREVTS